MKIEVRRMISDMFSKEDKSPQHFCEIRNQTISEPLLDNRIQATQNSSN